GFALMRGGAAVARDREMQTLDSQRLTALSPMELALGKLLGLTAPLHLLNACGLVLAIPAAALAGRSVALMVSMFAILAAATLCYCAFGLLMSTGSEKADVGTRRAIGLGAMITGVFAG